MRNNLILENWKLFLKEADLSSVAPTTATTPTTSVSDITAAVEKSKDELRKSKAKDAVKAALTVAKEQAKILGRELSEDEIRDILKSVGDDLRLSESKINEAQLPPGTFLVVENLNNIAIICNVLGEKLNIQQLKDFAVTAKRLYEQSQELKAKHPKVYKVISFLFDPTSKALEKPVNSVVEMLMSFLSEEDKNLNNINESIILEKKKKSGDRCTRIAKRKYDVWPSAYASGAVVKCRQGKIWKGISESATDEEIDQEILLEEIEIIEEELDESKKKDYKPNFSKEKEQGLHGWFARNKGKGWVNCRTGGPCGRDSADSGGKYPACRPTKAQCKSAGKGPLRKKKSSKPISWTKKK